MCPSPLPSDPPAYLRTRTTDDPETLPSVTNDSYQGLVPKAKGLPSGRYTTGTEPGSVNVYLKNTKDIDHESCPNSDPRRPNQTLLRDKQKAPETDPGPLSLPDLRDRKY